MIQTNVIRQHYFHAAPPPVPYISELITLLIGSPEFQQR